MIADVNVSLSDIAGGASINVRVRERGRRCRQRDDDIAGARPYGRDTNARYELASVIGGRYDLPLLRIGVRCAESQACGEQQESAAPEQKAAPAALSIRAIVRRFFGFAIDGRFALTIAGVIHWEVPRTRH
jgi:hypothetical protein